MVVRVFKYGSLVLAIGGLAVLLFAAIRSEVPSMEVGTLVGTMNWAYVRIEGVVSRQPTYDPEARTLRFWMRDETGEIMIVAYRSEAEMLLAEGLVPVMGDHIALEGTLRIKEDFQYLVLDVPQHTEILPIEVSEMSIADVDSGLVHQKVTVRGVIRGEHVPYEGLRILTLRDATGEIDVTLPSGTIALSGEVPDLSVGGSVQVTGAVDQYKGTPQISVGRASDIVALDEAIALAPLQRIDELSARDVEGIAVVEGAIAKIDPFSAGVKFTLDDGSGTVTLLLWQDLYESLADRGSLIAGATVRALGEMAEYRGELEIVPQIPSDVTVLATAEPAAAERQLGELGADDVGQAVGVEGMLRSLRMFSAGVKGMLDDGTGVVTILLWQEVYDGLSDPAALVPGAMLHVEGEVSEYKGELEVIPRVPADVTVVGMVELPSREQAIGQITTDDAGQTVQLAGQVTEVTLFSTGIKYILDDGTGTITLLLWQNLYDKLVEPDLLTTGAQVAVRGVVDEYQGELEIVPQVPIDVQVTSPDEMAKVLVTPTSEAVAGESESHGPTSEPTIPVVTSPAATTQPNPSPTPTPEVRVIGAISNSDTGKTITIAEAGIADVDYFSKGVKYTLTDSTGSIILLLWQNVLEEIFDRYSLFPGSQVQVMGEIAEYMDDLEIIPYHEGQVVVLSQGERLPIEERPANNVTPSDEGRIFRVEGVVTWTESRDWFKVWLNDGTGEILIFVPERTVPYLSSGIGMGVRLRVTGEVDIYNGVIEIIPLAGADVEVQ